MHKYQVSLGVPIKSGQASVITATSALVSEFRKNDDEMFIKTLDGRNISNDADIPIEKNVFDTFFQCRVKTRGTRDYVHSFFEINSTRTWRKIKQASLEFLKSKGLWLQRMPATASKQELVAIGMMTDVPIMASLSNVTNDIKYAIAEAKMALTSSMEATDADDHEASMYLQRSKVSSRYCTNSEGMVVEQRVEDTWATMVYTEKESTVTTSETIEKFAKNLPHNMKFIPMGIKYSDPGLFGRLLSNSSSARNKMRNIAICGITPKIMDYGNSLSDSQLLSSGRSLLEELQETNGILRIDPHRRTVDLGKWHITVTVDDHDSICEKIDRLFIELEENTTQLLKEENSCGDFQTPTRLQKKKRTATTQYSTKSATREDYTKWLLSGCDSSIPVVTKHAKFPIRAVSYKEAVINNQPTPSSPAISRISGKAPSLSSLTASTYQDMIDDALQKQQKINDQAMQKLSTEIKTLNDKMEAYQKTTIDAIVAGITDTEKSPFVTGKVFQEKFAMIDEKMTTMINKFSSILENTANITPARITQKRAKRGEAKIMDIDQHT